MRQAIETAPRDGSAIILEDDASGTYDVAHWSPEAGEWVGENGEPIKITPSHWFPMPGDKYLLHEDEGSSDPSRAGLSAWRARRYSFFPFSLRWAAPQRPTTGDVVAPRSVPLAAPVTVAAVESQTAPVEAKRTPHARQGFATSSIAAALVAAALIGVYFRAEVAAYVTQYAGLQDIVRVSAIGGQVVEQETRLSSQDSRKTDLLALQQQAEADQARAQAGAQVKQAVEASAPEARQSLEKEQRAEVLANDLAEARGAIDGLNLQLRAEAAQTAQLLGQEREKTAALVQDATAARRELTASTVQHGHALEEERARGAALASELATARREIETQAALLRKAGDEAVQLKQAAESAMAERRQSLEKEQRAEVLENDLAEARGAIDGLNLQLRAEAAQTAQLLGQEREKTAALVQDATAARRELTASTVQHGHALEEERARRAALASELATARREIETQVALLRKAGDEAVQLKQAAESAMAERRQSLQQERDRTEAMARDLESVGRTIDGRVTLERAANSQIAQVTQAAEVAATKQPATAASQGSPEATRLIARASALLGQGNIGAARIVLERAAETGSAQASFMLAETYDPVILSAWGTYGTRGEATKAREFYAKAHAGGIQEAKDRLNALR